MSESKITILHLSDIHFKRKKELQYDAYRRDVQDKLIDTIKAHLEAHRAVDVVAVTGDIAFSGKKKQYDEAMEFFSRLREVLPDKTGFLVVPGNHEVDSNLFIGGLAVRCDRFFQNSCFY
jgi:3',5'-cyclic AMP phosphodiesterase CpdA